MAALLRQVGEEQGSRRKEKKGRKGKKDDYQKTMKRIELGPFEPVSRTREIDVMLKSEI